MKKVLIFNNEGLFSTLASSYNADRPSLTNQITLSNGRKLMV